MTSLRPHPGLAGLSWAWLPASSHTSRGRLGTVAAWDGLEVSRGKETSVIFLAFHL